MTRQHDDELAEKWFGSAAASGRELVKKPTHSRPTGKYVSRACRQS
jgi:hypothetical protein